MNIKNLREKADSLHIELDVFLSEDGTANYDKSNVKYSYVLSQTTSDYEWEDFEIVDARVLSAEEQDETVYAKDGYSAVEMGEDDILAVLVARKDKQV